MCRFSPSPTSFYIAMYTPAIIDLFLLPSLIFRSDIPQGNPSEDTKFPVPMAIILSKIYLFTYFKACLISAWDNVVLITV